MEFCDFAAIWKKTIKTNAVDFAEKNREMEIFDFAFLWPRNALNPHANFLSKCFYF